MNTIYRAEQFVERAEPTPRATTVASAIPQPFPSDREEKKAVLLSAVESIREAHYLIPNPRIENPKFYICIGHQDNSVNEVG